MRRAGQHQGRGEHAASKRQAEGEVVLLRQLVARIHAEQHPGAVAQGAHRRHRDGQIERHDAPEPNAQAVDHACVSLNAPSPALICPAAARGNCCRSRASTPACLKSPRSMFGLQTPIRTGCRLSNGWRTSAAPPGSKPLAAAVRKDCGTCALRTRTCGAPWIPLASAGDAPTARCSCGARSRGSSCSRARRPMRRSRCADRRSDRASTRTGRTTPRTTCRRSRFASGRSSDCPPAGCQDRNPWRHWRCAKRWRRRNPPAAAGRPKGRRARSADRQAPGRTRRWPMRQPGC